MCTFIYTYIYIYICTYKYFGPHRGQDHPLPLPPPLTPSSLAVFQAGRHQEAVDIAQRAVESADEVLAHLEAPAAAGEAGKRGGGGEVSPTARGSKVRIRVPSQVRLAVVSTT